MILITLVTQGKPNRELPIPLKGDWGQCILKGRVSTMNGLTILVVDDECSVADAAATVLDRDGYCALALYSAAEAVAMLSKIDAALILSDINMPEIAGIDLALKTRQLPTPSTT